MIRKIFVIIAATAMLPVSLAASASASAAASAAPASPRVVIHGRILLKGKPVAGATVKLYADPLPSVLRRVREARKVPDALIGTAKSSHKGSYSISFTAKAMAVVRARAVRGIVNLHVLAFTHEHGTVLWFPRRVSLRSAGAGAVPSLAAPEAANLILPASQSTAMSAYVRSLLGPDAFNWNDCGQRFLMYPVGAKWVSVGNTYSNMAKVSMPFTYQTGSATTLGVGFSPSLLGSTDPGPGSLGLSFSENSSMSWNSAVTEPYAGHHGIVNDEYFTKFAYGAFFTVCAGESSLKRRIVSRHRGWPPLRGDHWPRGTPRRAGTSPR